jgi:polysaccharide biosynthesis transport protein
MGSLRSVPVQIHHLLNIFQRHALPSIVVGLTLGSLTALPLALKPPTYAAEGKLRFERLSPTSTLTGLGKEAADPQPLGLVSNPLNNEAETLRSRPLIQKTIDRLNLHDNQGHPLSQETFLRSLKVKDLLASDVMQIRYSSANPEETATIVNTLMAIYLEQYNSEYHQRNATAQNFLEKQLPQAETAVKQAENALSQFMQRHQLVAIKDQASAAILQTTDLQKQIAIAQAQLADADAQANILQESLGSNWQDNVQATATSQSPALLEAAKELRQVEGALITARSLYQEDHPEIQTLLTQQSRWQAIVSQNSPQLPQPLNPIQQEMTKDRLLLEQKRQGLAQQLTSLTQSTQQVQSRAQVLPELEKTQRQLQRQLESAQLAHSQVMARLSDIRLANTQNIGNARILSPALLPTKTSKSVVLPYLLGTLIGLLSAGATAWWRNAQDRTLQDIDTAKQVLNYPLLGVIPQWDSPPPADSTTNNWTTTSPWTAAYRMLHANLKYIKPQSAPKVIVITSSIPQEGKSTICANLALELAASGKRTLILDADLYRPRQHSLWNQPNSLGLGDLFLEDHPLSDAIHNLRQNLDLLPAGMLPPNSLALLDSPKMLQILANLTATYDMILIDSPPIHLAADGLLLGKLADGLLLVVRSHQVEIPQLKTVQDRLQTSNQTVLGMVINGQKTDNPGYNQLYFWEGSRSKIKA